MLTLNFFASGYEALSPSMIFPTASRRLTLAAMCPSVRHQLRRRRNDVKLNRNFTPAHEQDDKDRYGQERMLANKPVHRFSNTHNLVAEPVEKFSDGLRH